MSQIHPCISFWELINPFNLPHSFGNFEFKIKLWLPSTAGNCDNPLCHIFIRLFWHSPNEISQTAPFLETCSKSLNDLWKSWWLLSNLFYWLSILFYLNILILDQYFTMFLLSLYIRPKWQLNWFILHVMPNLVGSNMDRKVQNLTSREKLKNHQATKFRKISNAKKSSSYKIEKNL